MINKDLIISADFVAKHDISSLSDRPNTDDGLTAEALKKRFDALVKKAIASINGIIDQLNDPDVAEGIPIKLDGVVTVNSLKALVDAITNGQLSSILKVDGQSQFVNGSLTTVLEAIEFELDRRVQDLNYNDRTNHNGDKVLTLEWSTGAHGGEAADLPFVFRDDISSGAPKGSVPAYDSKSSLKAHTSKEGGDYDLINRKFLETLFNALKEEVEDNIAKAVSAAYTYRGSVDSYAELPSGPALGDVYDVKSEFLSGDKTYPAGTNVVWGEDGWEVLTGFIDVTKLVQKISGYNRVYTKNGIGNDDSLPYTSAATAGSIPVRDEYGNFYIDEGTNDYHCATVGQVNKKVDKSSVSMEATARTIAERSPDGNVRTKAPVNDMDCINLAYINTVVGDVNEALNILLNGGVSNG